MTPREQLDVFLDRFTPEVAKRTRRALAKVRKLCPGAIELVYDNYNALAIAFAPTERLADAVFSITLYPRWVSLFFTHGKGLPDPEKLLRGSGARIRHIVLGDAAALDDPAVRVLIDAALARAAKPLDPHRKRRLVIQSVSAKRRPRRPG